jgi:hypothetical protein
MLATNLATGDEVKVREVEELRSVSGVDGGDGKKLDSGGGELLCAGWYCSESVVD